MEGSLHSELQIKTEYGTDTDNFVEACTANSILESQDVCTDYASTDVLDKIEIDHIKEETSELNCSEDDDVFIVNENFMYTGTSNECQEVKREYEDQRSGFKKFRICFSLFLKH
jgi:hypothetical protein